ncbi:MAG: AAA family ATPase [Candidatus Nanoarchaeia archaeon]|nr:AAA family ATPase [Candidatus Nanoarchaeia archaeon]
MGLFDDALKDSESLFLNEIMLDFSYQPKLVRFRENQQKYMASCILPLLQKRNGKNLLITGTPGVGKTVCCRHVLTELKEYEEDIILLYLNCWKKDTSYKLALEMCALLGYKWVHNKRTDELFNEIKEIINKKNLVIVLDEVDKLQDFQILYFLVEEIYRKSMFLITNEKGWASELEDRLKSRLILDTLEFNPYTLDETKEILRERVRYAFVKGVFDETAFELVAQKAFELNDIRTGLFLLREAGNIAERKALRRIGIEHAQIAISQLGDYQKREIDKMEDDEKEIIELVKLNSGKNAQELLDIYKKDISLRTLQRKLDDLAKGGVILKEEAVSDQGAKVFVFKYGSLKRLDEF